MSDVWQLGLMALKNSQGNSMSERFMEAALGLVPDFAEPVIATAVRLDALPNDDASILSARRKQSR